MMRRKMRKFADKEQRTKNNLEKDERGKNEKIC